MKDILYLIWDNERKLWWKPYRHGYTSEIDEAGRYTEAEAHQCCTDAAMEGEVDRAVSMVAAPENWK